jgi:hypothetical protein
MIFAGIVDVMLPDHLSSSNQKRFLGAIVARDRACYQLRLIADNLSKAGWSWSCMSAVDRQGQTIFIADAHRDDGKRSVVHADEKLTAFLELESTVPHCAKK